MMQPALCIFDTMSQIFRAYYAIQNINAPDGTPVNAVFGFVHMLRKIMETRNPERLLAAADPGGPTHRHLKAAEYKANRKPTPEDLKAQVPMVFEFLAAFDIPVLVREGFEADDVIACLVREAKANGCPVTIFSSDKDLFQLVGEGVTVADTRAEVNFDPPAVFAKFGVHPRQIVDYLALTGDASDNIPGAPGVGPKTAVALLEKYGSLDACYERLEEVAPPRVREILRENRQRVLDSRELATLVPDVPLEWTWADLKPFRPDWERVKGLAVRYGFRSLLKWIDGQLPAGREMPAGRETPAPVSAVPAPRRSPGQGGLLLDGVADETGISVPTGLAPTERPVVRATVSGTAEPALLDSLEAFEAALARRPETPLAAVFTGEDHLCLHSEGGDGACLLGWEQAEWVLAGVLEQGRTLRVAGLKEFCRRAPGWKASLGGVQDVSLMHYLVQPHIEDHSLARVALDMAGIDLPPDPSGGGRAGLLAAAEDTPQNAARRAAALHPCAEILAGRLESLGLASLYRELELPLAPILVEMERVGILLDLDWLGVLAARMAERLAEREHRIHTLAGEVFNVNSPVQLGYILFEKLGITPGGRVKRTKKTGRYATGAEVLEQLAPLHPLPAAVLEHRHLAKLKSTYVDVLPRLADPRTGRIHTTFHQSVASTGRLSSANPNLQNIPIRTEEGREIRRAFVAPPGSVLLSADYSQIELRVMAHLSGDERLREAFAGGEDIHAGTAKAVFGARYEENPKEYRRRAKTINYGILYGQSEFGLAGGLNVSRREAREIIDAYFRTFPRVSRWVAENLESARREGVVRTLFGRIRPMPELRSDNAMFRQAGERIATNAPVQGTAADIMKKAMIRLDQALGAAGAPGRMLLQVHDELVVECPAEAAPLVSERLRTAMEGAAALVVPLVADVAQGSSWFEAKM